MKTFEFNGDKYAKASRHQKEWGNKLISELQLRGNESILDLGCGDGLLTKQLSLLVPKGSTIGIDASNGMIEASEKHKNENLSFIKLDINKMDFKSEFDIIFSNAALHWIKNHRLLLENTFSALKPNGKIFWNFAGAGTCSNFLKVINEKIKDDKYNKYFHDFEWPWYMPTKSEYEILIKNTGFSEISVIEENADRYFSNAEEMIKWLDQPSLVPFIYNVPDEIKDDFRNDVINDMLKRTLQPDFTCFETFIRIKVYAKK